MSANSTTQSRLLVHAYLDGELDPAHALEFERELAADPGLAAERDRVEALRQAIREKLPRETPPAGLVRRIERTIVGERAPATKTAALNPSWRALAASVLLALFVGSGGTWMFLGSAQSDGTADLMLANHLRALMAPQPTDVGSSDRHTVKPWFNGRIPEAPRVVDLRNQGFTLVGARIDVIGRMPVPTLVYRIRQHLISLTAVPAGARQVVSMPGPRTIAGYNIVSWTENGIGYWAVSDVAPADLETFGKDFRTATPEP